MYKVFILIHPNYVSYSSYQYFQMVYDKNLLYLENAYNMEIQRITGIYTKTVQETADYYKVRAKELDSEVDRCQAAASEAWYENPTPKQTLHSNKKYKEFSAALEIYIDCLGESKRRMEFLEKQYQDIILKIRDQYLVNIESLGYCHAVWVQNQINYLQFIGYCHVGYV